MVGIAQAMGSALLGTSMDRSRIGIRIGKEGDDVDTLITVPT